MSLPPSTPDFASPSPPRARVVPIKFRRKSLNTSDPDEAHLTLHAHLPGMYALSSSPPNSTYASHLYHDYSSASSSPIAPSLALGSTPSSPVECPRIRFESSEPDYYTLKYPLIGDDSHRDSLPELDYLEMGRLAGKGVQVQAMPHSYCSRAYSYAYSSPSPVSADLIDAPGFDAMASQDDHESCDDSDEDAGVDMDADLLSLPRRISFSTSCERDKPFVAPRPMLATRIARSCPPGGDVPSQMFSRLPSEVCMTSAVPSLSSTPSVDLPEWSPALSVPPPVRSASAYSPMLAPPTRVKPTSSLYALLNPVEEPCVSSGHLRHHDSHHATLGSTQHNAMVIVTPESSALVVSKLPDAHIDQEQVVARALKADVEDELLPGSPGPMSPPLQSSLTPPPTLVHRFSSPCERASSLSRPLSPAASVSSPLSRPLSPAEPPSAPLGLSLSALPDSAPASRTLEPSCGHTDLAISPVLLARSTSHSCYPTPLDDLPPSSPLSSPISVSAHRACSLKSLMSLTSSPLPSLPSSFRLASSLTTQRRTSPMSSLRIASPLSSLPSSPVQAPCELELLSSPVLTGLDASDPIPVDDLEVLDSIAVGNGGLDVLEPEVVIERVPPTVREQSRPVSILADVEEGALSKAKSRSRPAIDTSTPGRKARSRMSVSPVEPPEHTSTLQVPNPNNSQGSSKADVGKRPNTKPSKSILVQSQKRRKDTVGDPVRKRRRIVLSDSESESEDVQMRSSGKMQTKVEVCEKENEHRFSGDLLMKGGVRAEGQKPTAAARKARRKGKVVEDEDEDCPVAIATKVASSSTLALELRRVVAPERPSVPASAPKPDFSSLPLPLEEMQGMLIESLATSRASSLPASSLYTSLMSNRPALKESRSTRCDGVMDRKEWIGVIEDVLEAGLASSGVFEKVENTAKDAADHRLEAQWFYVPEKDGDQERAMLIRSMMPRPAKRSETKKSKQYYWRPLGKISRWDPEDDL